MISKITIEQLEACKTEKGGWSKETLTLLGVPWPPPKGWKKKLLGGEKINPKKRRKRKRRKQITAARKSFYKTAEWAKLRYEAIKKSDGRCQACGRGTGSGAILHADHIKSIRYYPHLRAEPDNIQVLCASCNWGKGAKDSTDWREPRLSVLMSEDLD